MENGYKKIHLHSSIHYTSIHYVWIAIIIHDGSWLLYLAHLESKAFQ
jgi:hypothetical protein